MALRTEPHLSEPGFSGFPDFQDYPYQGFPQRSRCGWECRSHLGEYTAKPHLPRLGVVSKVAIRRSLICLNQDFQDYQIFRIIHIKGVRRGAGAVEVVMLVCSDVRYAHMCSGSTRAQYEVKRGQNMKKIDRYKMALRTELHLSEPGFSGLPDFQDYRYFLK